MIWTEESMHILIVFIVIVGDNGNLNIIYIIICSLSSSQNSVHFFKSSDAIELEKAILQVCTCYFDTYSHFKF